MFSDDKNDPYLLLSVKFPNRICHPDLTIICHTLDLHVALPPCDLILGCYRGCRYLYGGNGNECFFKNGNEFLFDERKRVSIIIITPYSRRKIMDD